VRVVGGSNPLVPTFLSFLPMQQILLTNDDGIDSHALAALEAALSRLDHDFVVVAPDRERSAASHCITIDQLVPFEQLAGNRFAVGGTPADCVIAALDRILNERPALVISGINRGCNLGSDIPYSGTVAAASEAALQGIPAIAVSAHHLIDDFAAAAEVAVRIAAQVLEHGLPPDVILNVNYPLVWNGEFRLTRQGRRRSAEPFTDYEALRSGYVSISPLHIDRTAHMHFEHCEKLFSHKKAQSSQNDS
jgi:5'-nucleotidase